MRISPHDKKVYQSLVLDNGLKVLLIESETATKAACSLVVNVGSFDDPFDRPGFAHFVEHLLFKTKSTDNTLFNDFIASHGGHCNAWTATEHSCFHFDIATDYLSEALSHFSSMFSNPNFAEEDIQQEQQAIHAEYKLKLKDDGRRIQQVHKETCNNKHPFSKFAVGNRHTLSDLPGRPVIKEINKFWQQHYCASKMTLAVFCPNIKKTTKDIVQYFSGLTSADQSKQKDNNEEAIYNGEHLGIFIKVKPLKQLHKLNITFALPNTNQWYKNKISSLLAHIINYEGPNSLFDVLRCQKLINFLSAGNGIQGYNFKDFNVSFELTEFGEQNIDLILEHTFAFLNKIKTSVIPPYIYKEQQHLSDISFNYQEDIKPIHLTDNIALSMHYYPEQDVLFGDYRMDGFCSDSWNKLLSYFTADNMRVTLLSQNVETNKLAHWYHTEYSVTKFSQDQLNILNNMEAGSYSFPKPNPYLQTPVTLRKADFSHQSPILLSKNEYFRFWFKQDVSYRVPKGNIYVSFDLLEGVADKNSQTLLRLFCELFLDEVSEQHYQAEMAGLHYNLYAHNTGITIYTSGLSNNQHKLMNALIEKLFTVSFSQTRFLELKKQLIKHWQNNLNSKPLNQLFTHLNNILLPNLANSEELAEILTNVDFERFTEFRERLFNNTFIESLCYGNWSQKDALHIQGEIEKVVNTVKLTKELPRPQVAKLQFTNRMSVQTHQNDHAALYYVRSQLEDFDINNAEHLKQKAQFIVLSTILAPFAFDYLRQQHNLGYLAGSGYMPLVNSAGIAIYVQSHNVESTILMDHIERSIVQFKTELLSMQNEEFQRHKQAAKHQYAEIPSNLQQKAQLFWSSIGQQDFSFSIREKLVQTIDSTTQQAVVDCLSHWIDNRYPVIKLITSE